MEIKDLAGISEPLTRLIEVIAQGIGAASQPYLVRANADAEAYRIRAISTALEEVAKKNNLPVAYKDGSLEVLLKPEDKTFTLEAGTVEERSNLRLNYQERKRQLNLESVTSFAAAELAGDESVSPEKPDDDWVTRFFGCAQDVSSEEMQNIWGRILAGEIRRPGAYSLRTMEFVKNMTKEEAEVFTQMGKLAVKSGNSAFIDIQNETWLKENHKILQGHHFFLSEIDLMYPTDLQLQVFIEPTQDKKRFLFGEHLLLIERGTITSPVNISTWKFTSIGYELLSLIPPHLDDEYLEKLAQLFIQRGGKAFLGKIKNKFLAIGDKIEYDILREITIEQEEAASKGQITPT